MMKFSMKTNPKENYGEGSRKKEGSDWKERFRLGRKDQIYNNKKISYDANDNSNKMKGSQDLPSDI